MKIGIHGLGYIGSFSLAWLAQSGHDIIGVDFSPNKVDLINRGESPAVEKGLERIIQQQRRKRKISTTLDAEVAALQTEVSHIYVGTSSQKNGHLDLKGIFSAARISEGPSRRRPAVMSPSSGPR